MRVARCKLTALALGLTAIAASVAQAGQAQEPKQPAKATYAELLARAKQADPALDFTALRMAYAESDQYSPYGGGRQVYEDALRSQNHAEAIRLGEAGLEKNFLDVWAHWAVWQGAHGLGDEKRMAFHQYMLRGMLDSIQSSGDGQSPETAFKVISTDETYFLLTLLGLRPKSQALQRKDGHTYDAMTVTDAESGEELTLYFNVDLSFGYMQRLLDSGKKKSTDKPAKKS